MFEKRKGNKDDSSTFDIESRIMHQDTCQINQVMVLRDI
jgi:hypothetical protein